MIELTIIIPTCNEQDLIQNTIKQLYDSIKKCKIETEVIVVDYSKDNTYKILNSIKNKYKNLRVISHKGQPGVGSQIKNGFRKASGKYILIVMADYSSTEFQILPTLIKRFREGNQLIQTTRLKGRILINDYPFVKAMANRFCNLFINLVFLRFDLQDFTSLYKGIRADCIDNLKLESNDFEIGLEISMKAIKNNYLIKEVAVKWKKRTAGKSKFSLFKMAPKYVTRIIKTTFGF